MMVIFLIIVSIVAASLIGVLYANFTIRKQTKNPVITHYNVQKLTAFIHTSDKVHEVHMKGKLNSLGDYGYYKKQATANYFFEKHEANGFIKVDKTTYVPREMISKIEFIVEDHFVTPSDAE